ncbi:hypothetical protein TNCV_1474261 [Trichonephila clavipes]|nr:hypothetical protein TNCV_1474261 [Trichonephila clavipes]
MPIDELIEMQEQDIEEFESLDPVQSDGQVRPLIPIVQFTGDIVDIPVHLQWSCLVSPCLLTSLCSFVVLISPTGNFVSSSSKVSKRLSSIERKSTAMEGSVPMDPPCVRRWPRPRHGCQVIYSQFGLAIHQNDHQARRRFVEWAQNEIAVVPDFHKRILFNDEAHFWLNGYVNKQNCRIWSEAIPQVYVETPLHPEKLTVWCALWAGGILLQKR